MTISLSEQLESDIKAYLHKTFGTYFSSLDERFAADIKEDVINASDFHHGYYNDDDISITFQRVTLGRMGHPDWQIYHSCTDTEVNTMKQNVKVNTPIHIRPASPRKRASFIRNSRRLPTRSWVRSAMCGWTSDPAERILPYLVAS
ncbi:MAG: hypothetical protein V8Q30_03350 [Acutalibacteraceae bacterium]